MRRNCEKKVAGVIQFGAKIDVTDPCYNRDVWCRINDLEIVPGDYTCVAFIKNTGSWGRRVVTAGIYLNGKIPKASEMECCEDIGVDAGLAGFFDHKPDFTDEQWGRFCDLVDDYPSVVLEDSDFFRGFVTSSGYGDGGYPLYVARDEHGRICACELRFL